MDLVSEVLWLQAMTKLNPSVKTELSYFMVCAKKTGSACFITFLMSFVLHHLSGYSSEHEKGGKKEREQERERKKEEREKERERKKDNR